MNDPVLLIRELIKIDAEQPWLEFKTNNSDPEKIGRTISALSNGAALIDHDKAYLVWGVNDSDHKVIGTDFDITSAKKGNEDLINWLRSAVSDNTDFVPFSCVIEGKTIRYLEINKAAGNPVSFQNIPYIRDQSYVKRLSDLPALERRLWQHLQGWSSEMTAVSDCLSANDVIQTLDCRSVISLLRLPNPDGIDSTMELLKDNGLVVRGDDGRFSIPMMSALLFGADLGKNNILMRKRVRLVKYIGISKVRIEKEVECPHGYANSFEDMMRYVSLLLPSEEIVEGAVRRATYPYPLIAIREVLANALMHQDLSLSGMGIIVEVFDDRVVITNPGKLIVDVNRIVNAAPRSRNEKMANMMRRMGLCEELGSGWDKIIESCEEHALCAPTIHTDEMSTEVIMVYKRPFVDYSRDEKIWSCYMHACIMYSKNQRMTNSSLRSRFGLESNNSAQVTMTRLIRDVMEEGLIKIYDDKASPKSRSYVPYWV